MYVRTAGTCNLIIHSGRVYERTQRIHPSVTSKVHNVDLLNFPAVSNALQTSAHVCVSKSHVRSTSFFRRILWLKR